VAEITNPSLDNSGNVALTVALTTIGSERLAVGCSLVGDVKLERRLYARARRDAVWHPDGGRSNPQCLVPHPVLGQPSFPSWSWRLP